MKRFLLSGLIISFLISCSNGKDEEIKYDIYSSVLEKEFKHLLLDSSKIVGINDTLKDMKDELGTLIYSIQNNKLFFDEYCQGDTSFKSFILDIKRIELGTEKLDLEKLRKKTRIKINLDKLIITEPKHQTIYFSKMVLNKNQDRAILFVTESSSNSWIFIELIKNKWIVKHKVETLII